MTNEALYDEELETSADDEFEPSQGYEEDHEQPLNHEEDEPGWPSQNDASAEFEQAEYEQAQSEPQTLDPLDQLPMALTLRCGSLNLTLGDLRRVAAGTVLQVSGITPGFATLCHGERVVAEGELVDVDGRLGLQITRMASPA